MKENLAFEICKILQQNGVAYITGGYTRNLIMENEGWQSHPSDDIDIATSVKPNAICFLLHDNGIQAIYDSGKSFGVVRAKKDGDEVEVATFRADGIYKDGRHPENVRFVDSLEEDARRRDFTCNAIYYDPISKHFSDPVGGIGDIREGRLKCVGQPIERFEEDYLRMMRYCRFRAKLGFKFDKELKRIIRRSAHKIHNISMERIKMEFDKAIQGPRFWQFINDLNRVGILFHILPEVAVLQYITPGHQEYHREGSVYRHTLEALRRLDSNKVYEAEYFQEMAERMFDHWETILWSTLLHDIGKRTAKKVKKGKASFKEHEFHSRDIAENILDRFKFSTQEKNKILWIIENHIRVKSLLEMKKGKRREMLWQPNIVPLLFVRLADDLGNFGTRDAISFFDGAVDHYLNEPQGEAKIIVTNELKEFTDGEMIMKEMGLKAGKAVGDIKEIIHKGYLEGDIKTIGDVKKLLARLKEVTVS